MNKGKMAALAAAAAAALSSAPALAFAADGGSSFSTAVTDITGKGSDIITTIAMALLTLVAALAFLLLAKEILPALASREKPEFNRRVTACIVIIVICIIAAFTPTIIDAIVDIAGTNVDLGHVSQ